MSRRDFLFVGAVALFMAGCGGGPEGGDVKLAGAGGTVTFKGSPLAGATVTFIPEVGPIATATTDLSGKFKLFTAGNSGVAVGKCAVTVVAMEGGGSSAAPSAPAFTATSATNPDEMAKKSEDMKKAMMGNSGAAAPGVTAKSIIPTKYNTAAESGLSYTIESDATKNDFKITLTE